MYGVASRVGLVQPWWRQEGGGQAVLGAASWSTLANCSTATGTLHDEFVQTADTSDLGIAVGSSRQSLAQSFTSSGDAETVTGVCFRLKKTGSPSGSIKAAIYAHSGSLGSTSVPTGAALVESAEFDVADLTTSPVNYFFPLSGWAWDASTNYTVVLDGANALGSALNLVEAIIETAAEATHAGNLGSYDGSSWSAESGNDLAFKVYYSTGELADGSVRRQRRGWGFGFGT